jgi:uncharacterized protein involved in outer membrane biogenesis
MPKLLVRVVAGIAGGLLLLLATAFTLLYIYEDEIVGLFVKQANRYLKTPVTTSEISVSLFADFPNASLQFNNVEVQESFSGSTEPLLKADRLYASFSLLDIINQQYEIASLELQGGSLNLRLRPDGSVNYEVLDNEPGEAAGNTQALEFNLKHIQLTDMHLAYNDARSEQLYSLLAKDLSASLGIANDVYSIDLLGDITSDSLIINGHTWLIGQPMKLEGNFDWNNNESKLTLHQTRLQWQEADLRVTGSIATDPDLDLDLLVDAPTMTFQALAGLLPEKFIRDIKAYRSTGEFAVNGTVKGLTDSEHIPAIEAKFSATDARFYHPDYKQAIENIKLSGSYTNGAKRHNTTSVLRINQFSATLAGKPIRGSFSLNNFDDPYLTFDTKSQIPAEALLKFYPIPEIQSAAGVLNVEMDFAGRLNDLKQSKTLSRVKTNGEIVLQQVGFQRKGTPFPVKALNGSLIFRQEDLALSNLSGKAGQSQFVVNGLFKNVFAYLLLENQPITVEADLQSSFINLDELLQESEEKRQHRASASTGSKDGEKYLEFSIRPDLDLYFNCKIDRLQFDRLRAKSIGAELTVKNSLAKITNSRLLLAGGSAQVSGTVDARKAGQVRVNAKSQLNDIYADSLFYIFRNFNQDFISEKHIKGRITADVEAYLPFDEKLRLNYDGLVVSVNTTVKNGRLKDFSPMLSLSDFISEKRLRDIEFSDIESRLDIRDQTIFLPSTIIRSDITTITLSGTHTFEQAINYNVKLPLKAVLTGKRKEMPETAVRPTDGTSHLFLRIVGTTDDFKILYDTQAVKEKIAQDIKKEGQELKEVFKNKGREPDKNVVAPDEDDYFDFDE